MNAVNGGLNVRRVPKLTILDPDIRNAGILMEVVDQGTCLALSKSVSLQNGYNLRSHSSCLLLHSRIIDGTQHSSTFSYCHKVP